MATVVEIKDLSKAYGRRGRRLRALDGFDMVVESGQVHGFLGPNGAGKTTALRTLLGLIRADAGSMWLLGEEVPAALPRVVDQVGAIVESPQFVGHLSGRDTLLLLARARDVPTSTVGQTLDLVGLRERARDRVKSYSLGMKQRLAVASALLKRPRLLVLDEPSNGLDPAGIREMRQLMRDLASAGTTVVFSSHILGEVQQACDAVTLISRGRRVAYGPMEDLLESHSSADVRVRLDSPTDHPRAAEALRAAGARVSEHPEHLLVHGLEKPAWVTRVLADHDLAVAELTPLTADLESIFLRLTGGVAAPGQVRQVDAPGGPDNSGENG